MLDKAIWSLPGTSSVALHHKLYSTWPRSRKDNPERLWRKAYCTRGTISKAAPIEIVLKQYLAHSVHFSGGGGANTLQALWFILVSEHFQALSPGQLPEVDSVPGEQSFGIGCLTNSWTDIQKSRITVGGSLPADI